MADETLPEEMGAFFDQRAEGYDAHMRQNLADAQTYYRELARPIEQTLEPLKIVDIGCGTGLEIPAILEKAPNAHLTCIDLSAEMLRKLKDKFPQKTLSLVQASYLSYDFGCEQFDAALSSMTLHHLLPDDKLTLYQKIFCCLHPGCVYIEGDYMVTKEKMAQLMADYASQAGAVDAGKYHIDIPLSIDDQISLLNRAGFQDISLIYKEDENVILAAHKLEGKPDGNL